MQAGHLRVRHAGGHCQERAILRPAALFTFRDVADAAVVVIAKVSFFDLVSATWLAQQQDKRLWPCLQLAGQLAAFPLFLIALAAFPLLLIGV